MSLHIHTKPRSKVAPMGISLFDILSPLWKFRESFSLDHGVLLAMIMLVEQQLQNSCQKCTMKGVEAPTARWLCALQYPVKSVPSLSAPQWQPLQKKRTPRSLIKHVGIAFLFVIMRKLANYRVCSYLVKYWFVIVVTHIDTMKNSKGLGSMSHRFMSIENVSVCLQKQTN